MPAIFSTTAGLQYWFGEDKDIFQQKISFDAVLTELERSRIARLG